MSNKPISKEKRKQLIVIFALMLLAFIGGMLANILLVRIAYPNALLLKNFFADVDGDRLPDYVVFAFFVLNKGGVPNDGGVSNENPTLP